MQGAKVLVVDDSTSVRKVLERLLTTRGLQVFTAETAEQGLEQANGNSPNLVIADVVMPGMNGFELCQSLRLDSRTKDIPVILISGIINDGVVAQANQAGAFAVVSKPFTPDDLFPKIEAALAHAVGARRSAEGVIPTPAPAPVPVIPSPTPEPAPKPVAAPERFTREPAPTPSPTPTPPSGSRLQDELKPFVEKAEVEIALLTHSSAKLLAWAGQPLEDPEALAAYIRTLLSISGVMGEKYQFSTLQAMQLEYMGKTLVVSRISDTATLTLVIKGTGGSGVIRYLILKQMPHLKEALAGM